MIELNIIPECYVDTKVAEIVGRAKRTYNHQHGCGNVANKLKKLLNEIAIGIIDEDANKGRSSEYLSEFIIFRKESDLILKKHPDRLHYLILICPEIEKWLMINAKTVNINPADNGLENELKDFTKQTKVENINKNEGFVRFIKQLINAEAPGITTLKTWLTLFNQGQLHTLHN